MPDPGVVTAICAGAQMLLLLPFALARKCFCYCHLRSYSSLPAQMLLLTDRLPPTYHGRTDSRSSITRTPEPKIPADTQVAMMKSRIAYLVLLLFLFIALPLYSDGEAGGSGSAMPWWGWLIILFILSFGLGIVSVVAGIGGGVLFVPIVSGLFPFHLDFVRGAGLLVALAGSLSAGPGLLRKGLADLKLALPMVLVSSISAVFGASVGLVLPVHIIEILLGISITFIAFMMALFRNSENPSVERSDRLSNFLGISGSYHEEFLGETVDWKMHRSIAGLMLFVIIGFMGGVFGLGAGWANVPVLNLLLGAPLKVSVATSIFVISINGTAASWVYLNSGAVLPLIAVPSVAGIMLGTRLGARVLARAKPKIVRYLVVGFLFLAGVRSVLKGFQILV